MRRLLTLVMIIVSGLPGLLNTDAAAQGSGNKRPPENDTLVTITQGIWGNVWLWEGDFMPGPDGSRGKVTAVRREVRVYEPASMESLVPASGTRFTKVKARLVKKVKSCRNGFYQVSLPPGQYSIVVKDGSSLYANWFDGRGYILPVTVVKDSVTKFQIDMTEGATH